MAGLLASTEYLPIRRGVKVYSPLAPVVVVSVIEVASLVRVTVALGMTAPEVSRTVPKMAPVSTWARAKRAANASREKARNGEVDMRAPLCWEDRITEYKYCQRTRSYFS